MSDLIYFESEITRTLDATLAQAEFVQAPVATMSGCLAPVKRPRRSLGSSTTNSLTSIIVRAAIRSVM